MTPGSPTTPLAKSGKLLLLFGALVLAFIAGIGLWSFVLRRSLPQPAQRAATPAGSSEQTATESAARRAATPLPTNVPIDTDHDGLTDEDETGTYRTDPKNADTDRDGLADKSEARLYRTNPQQSDSDGDGTNDGDEVRRGQNPNGDGALLDTAAAIEQLKNSAP